MSNTSLPDPLSELFEANEPEARVLRVWRGIEARRQRRTASRALRAGVVTALACCAVGVAVVTLLGHSRHREGPEQVARSAPALAKQLGDAGALDSIVEAKASARALDFGDGASVTVGPGAKLEVLERTAHTVTLALRRGLAQFDIRPGGARRWRIESGGVTVEVVGTQFSVERGARTVRVEVQRGRVLMRGADVPGQVQALDAGSVLVVEAAGEMLTSESALSLPQPAPTVSRPARRLEPAARAAASEAGGWRQAATEQDWGCAWRALGPDGVVQQSRETDDVADLLALSDVARLSGHPSAAIAPLQKIVDHHAHDPRAGLAAFSLGRVWLDALGEPGLAVAAFREALRLKLPVSLMGDAQARLVEALASSGDSEGARAAAAIYRSRYPSGARRADVDRWSPPR